MPEHVALTDLVAINPKYNLAKGEAAPFLEMAKLPVIGSKISKWDQKAFNGGGSRFQNGDTLFARITPCTENGKIGFVDSLCDGQTAFGSTEFTVISPKDGTHPQFVYYLCASNHVRMPAIESMIGSTGRQRVPNWIFKNIKVTCFSFAEQERIAEILSSVDESIRAAEAVIAQAERVKRGLMEDLLTDGLGNEAIAHGEAPEGWELGRISNLCEINSENLTSKTASDFAFNYVAIVDVSDGQILGSVETTYAEAPSRARRIVRDGDMVVSTVRPYLKGFSKIKAQQDGFVVSTGFCVLRPIQGRTILEFINQIVFSEAFIEHLKQRMAGSNYPAVKATDVGDFQFPIPPFTEQVHIAKILSSVDDQIVANRASAEQLRRLKRGLMDDLLTGRVRTVS